MVTLLHLVDGGVEAHVMPTCTSLIAELGGVVTDQECRTLAGQLKSSAGGLYLLPRACSRMLKAGKAAPSSRCDKDNMDKNDQ